MDIVVSHERDNKTSGAQTIWWRHDMEMLSEALLFV